jgi:PAS domain S-box-containing protein
MDERSKTKEQLLREVLDLRARIRALGAPEVEQEAIETELRTARQRLQYLLGVSPAIIYTTHASGDFACTFVSENLQAIMGYSVQEMTTDPKGWPDRLHAEDASRVFQQMAPLIAADGGSIEYRFRHRDGHYVWIQDTFKVIRDDSGAPVELVGAWADITERKRAEEGALRANAELDETKRYLTRLIQSSPDAIISTDGEGKVILFSEGAETLLGHRAEEVAGRPVALLYASPERVLEVMREIRKRGGSVAAFESVLRAKDGESIPVLISASVLIDEDGREVGMVGFHSDLRERKRVEEALRKGHEELERRVEERTIELKAARERLQYLLTVTPGIIYTNRPSDYRCTFVSENVDPVMGFAPWEMLEDDEFWGSRIHADDRQRVFAAMAPLMDKDGGTIEYRFRHRDGHYVWIQDTFKVIRDHGGRPLEIVGSWADISDRKEAEQALGERMALMNDLQTLVAASPSVIYTTKVTGDYACTFVSENLKTTMGYAPWEMREDAKFWSKRLHPEDSARVFAEMAPLIERGGGTIEYRFRHRRGHYIWIQDTFTVMSDKEGKASELVGSWADISERKLVEAELQRLAEQVELRNRFIRQTFGRYLNDEVVATLLESPAGPQAGGEKRKVTMLMADLRGFTALSERSSPERVVTLLNRYLTTMVGVVKAYEGTIDEFIGDAIFVLFGAPLWREDDAQRAVACAVAMQLAMTEVNARNRADDLPEVEMGVGIHTGQVVVGNIGSPDRMKYGVVGSHVNLTARIQSCTTGGQILVSESTRQEVGSMLRIGQQIEVRAKGVEHPVMVAEVLGIGGSHKLFLPDNVDAVIALAEEIPVNYSIVEGSQLGAEVFEGSIVKLSAREAEARLAHAVPGLSNLKIDLVGASGEETPPTLYGKVVTAAAADGAPCRIRFTSMSPAVEALLRRCRELRTPAAAA